MTPNTHERLNSVVRALSEVVLPHLPPEASLAQEQVQLCIGQLQILGAQLDAIPAYEREELDDAIAIAKALSGISGGPETQAAQTALAASVDSADGRDVREQRKAINTAVETLVHATSADGDDESKSALTAIILEYEHARAQKDRAWFAPFGFDTL